MKEGSNGRTALSCSRYHVHEGMSAFSRHRVKSTKQRIALRQLHPPTRITQKPRRTLRLHLARDARPLLLLLHRRRLRLGGRGTAAPAEEHAREPVPDRRADGDGACGGGHLREHPGSLCGRSVRRSCGGWRWGMGGRGVARGGGGGGGAAGLCRGSGAGCGGAGAGLALYAGSVWAARDEGKEDVQPLGLVVAVVVDVVVV